MSFCGETEATTPDHDRASDLPGDHGLFWLERHAGRPRPCGLRPAAGTAAPGSGRQSAAKAERDGWETRVAGLRARHLDPDTLDERARAMLNLAEPNEVIVKLGPQEKLF